MDFWVWMMLAAIGVHAIKSRDQARRIAFLALHLGAYSVERLMEQIMQGYMRALGETDAERQADQPAAHDDDIETLCAHRRCLPVAGLRRSRCRRR